MVPNPIRRALSSIRTNRVKALLMGGQACILYGAAEFSRDIDIALLVDEENLGRLRALLGDLGAEPIAVPPFEADYLLRGHAVHFRCRAAGLENLRLDVMAVMRGVDPFPLLWERRTTAVGPEGEEYELLSLTDLVQSKKTQRDKDWPMIRRLVEASYFGSRDNPTDARIDFWLRQMRTPELLVEVARAYPAETGRLKQERPLLEHAIAGDAAALAHALLQEELAERERDREYWTPLRQELAALRRQRLYRNQSQ